MRWPVSFGRWQPPSVLKHTVMRSCCGAHPIADLPPLDSLEQTLCMWWAQGILAHHMHSAADLADLADPTVQQGLAPAGVVLLLKAVNFVTCVG